MQPRLLAFCFAETTQSTLHIYIFILELPHSTFDHMHLWPAEFIRLKCPLSWLHTGFPSKIEGEKNKQIT